MYLYGRRRCALQSTYVYIEYGITQSKIYNAVHAMLFERVFAELLCRERTL